MTLKTQWLGSFALKGQSVPQKLGMKLLEMVKDMKIKYSVSSPPKSMGGLFPLKKAFHRGTSIFGRIYGEIVLHRV